MRSTLRTCSEPLTTRTCMPIFQGYRQSKFGVSASSLPLKGPAARSIHSVRRCLLINRARTVPDGPRRARSAQFVCYVIQPVRGWLPTFGAHGCCAAGAKGTQRSRKPHARYKLIFFPEAFPSRLLTRCLSRTCWISPTSPTTTACCRSISSSRASQSRICKTRANQQRDGLVLTNQGRFFYDDRKELDGPQRSWHVAVHPQDPHDRLTYALRTNRGQSPQFWIRLN